MSGSDQWLKRNSWLLISATSGLRPFGAGAYSETNETMKPECHAGPESTTERRRRSNSSRGLGGMAQGFRGKALVLGRWCIGRIFWGAELPADFIEVGVLGLQA